MNDSISEKLLQQFHYFINIIHRGHHHQHFKANELNFGHGQGHLLTILLEHDGLSQMNLGTQLHIRPASLGELVDKLEQNGYVERRVNDNDKRVWNVYLTEEGRKITNEVMKTRQETIGTIFPGLSEDEKQQLSALMGKLIASMEENSVDNEDDFQDQRNIHHEHHRMEMNEREGFPGRPNHFHRHDHHNSTFNECNVIPYD